MDKIGEEDEEVTDDNKMYVLTIRYVNHCYTCV